MMDLPDVGCQRVKWTGRMWFTEVSRFNPGGILF
jgi:hypothetical protein